MFKIFFRKIHRVRRVSVRNSLITTKHSKLERAQLTREARILVHARLEYFNQLYGFSYNRIFIKNQKSRWGSCSSKKNLNFNYRIALLPTELQDYLIVHELCHLAEMNHSKNFWKLVERAVPEYKRLNKRLKTEI